MTRENWGLHAPSLRPLQEGHKIQPRRARSGGDSKGEEATERRGWVATTITSTSMPTTTLTITTPLAE